MTVKSSTSSILALEVLQQEDLAKAAPLERRRSEFTKHYRALPTAERKKLCIHAVDLIADRFANEVPSDDVLWIFLGATATERDWDTLSHLIDTIVQKVSNSDLHREISLCLLDFADNDQGENAARQRVPIGPTALVMLTEMGLALASRAGKSKLDRNVAAVVEYITSNLLARSNVSNNAMRLSLIHYLARCPLNSNSTPQLTRVINRFGHTLLEDLMESCFVDKKRSNAAFHFLLQHLKAFFTSSPALAEMSMDVLKHYMLRFPDEFPGFISGYCARVSRDPMNVAVATRCVTLLMINASEIGRRPLTMSLASTLLEFLSGLGDTNDAAIDHREQIHVALQLAIPVQEKHTAKDSSLGFFVDEATRLLNKKTHTGAPPPTPGRRPHKPHLSRKAVRFGEEPSPLDSILALAS